MTVSPSAERRTSHILNLLTVPAQAMFDDRSTLLRGIVGFAGATAASASGLALGVDRVRMAVGTHFPLHIHAGDHLLYILSGTGFLHFDGTDHQLSPGDSIFVPAEHPHGVRGPERGDPLEFLAFGVPHHPVGSATRMTVVHA